MTDAALIRNLGGNDRADFLAVMARAFEQDPLFLATFRGGRDDGSERRVLAFLSFLFDMNRLMGGTPRGLFVGGRLVACALLEPPSTSSIVSAGRMMASALRFLPVAFALPPRATAFLNGYMKRTRAAVPSCPHAYLVMLGVQPGEQGRGFGRRMVQDAIERTRTERRAAGIALDTENEDNVRLYERWGFRKVTSLDLGCVEAHCMFRPIGETA